MLARLCIFNVADYQRSTTQSDSTCIPIARKRFAVSLSLCRKGAECSIIVQGSTLHSALGPSLALSRGSLLNSTAETTTMTQDQSLRGATRHLQELRHHNNNSDDDDDGPFDFSSAMLFVLLGMIWFVVICQLAAIYRHRLRHEATEESRRREREEAAAMELVQRTSTHRRAALRALFASKGLRLIVTEEHVEECRKASMSRSFRTLDATASVDKPDAAVAGLPEDIVISIGEHQSDDDDAHDDDDIATPQQDASHDTQTQTETTEQVAETTTPPLSNLSQGCAICMEEEYDVGDALLISPNQNCRHIFHEECILEYLIQQSLKQDERTGRVAEVVLVESAPCPYCRQDFLCLSKKKKKRRKKKRLESQATTSVTSVESPGASSHGFCLPADDDPESSPEENAEQQSRNITEPPATQNNEDTSETQHC